MTLGPVPSDADLCPRIRTLTHKAARSTRSEQRPQRVVCMPAYALVKELLGAKRDLDLPRALRKARPR